MSVSKALTVQGRVLWALMLREIHTIYGNTYLGYLWVLINSAFGVGIFWALREFMGFRPPHGMSTPTFLIIGFAVWSIFTNIVTKSMAAVSGNKTLLTFPQITPLDLMLSRIMVIVATEILIAIIMLLVSLVLGYTMDSIRWEGVLIVLFYLISISFGLGTILATLCIFIPTIQKVVPMILRIMFFCSGVFFSFSMLPLQIREILAWNPIWQLIEYARNSVAQNYNAPGVDFSYLTILSLVFLFFGLLLERYGRNYLAEVK